jgi:hypothetical protein
MIIVPPIRKTDAYGSGHFGASRGVRTHKGIDFACYPGSEIYAPATGIISKLGYPYGDDLSFRYVEIFTDDELRVRVFYIKPIVISGENAIKGITLIGISQELGVRYPSNEHHAHAITEHVHVEVKSGETGFIDPTDMLT